MKRWLPILILILLVAVIVFVLNQIGVFKTRSTEDLKNSIEIVDFQSKWVKKLYQDWPPRLILVPRVTFRVKNIGNEPLDYVNFTANFLFENDFKNFGDSFRPTFGKKPLLPGEISDEISLQSNFGVDGRTKSSFINNPNWKRAMCKLFASSKGSQYIHIKDLAISRIIDFEEPKDIKNDSSEENK